uniref:ATP synthase subunit a n=1 Tax=Plethodon shenandoah TaxID=141978 RepID=A0A4Y5P4A3_9SALA|nr:ATP synthase F0 subunit 6 [Plethodon shenandoah]QCW58087.1 ATP synthase F0 subunit 6 [Plethodon shenandoah]QCW58100.1 ATP synthase F0 subunit 6 [Plethodon shenandoah]QCW58113.1 ATP synthase F0 subunit 6 [Plethodon shenandoah]QCW58139.1 ATP synthase F0 subunit 6 [Plethodon shenandoah]
MILNFFDQFLSPTLLGMPLIFLSLAFMYMLIPTPLNHWLDSRPSSLLLWFLHNFIKQLMNPLNQNAHKWSLLFISLMMFLMSMNLLGLIPYTFTPTTQLSLNIGLAVPLWLTTILVGLRNQPTTSAGHLLPESTPILLIPVLILIETVSLLIRPLALGVRLTANLTAGHLLIQLTSTATFMLISLIPTMAAVEMMILFLLMLLEIAVAAIQAYVFVLLLSLYLQENT